MTLKTFNRVHHGRMHLLDQPESVPYSPYLLAFVHEGDECRHPYVSECGRFSADPKSYGFEEIETGGGCRALYKMTDDGRELWITDPSGCYLPDTGKYPIEGILGLRIGMQTVAWIDLPDIPFASDRSFMDEVMDEVKVTLDRVDHTFDAGDRIEMLCRILREVNIRIAENANAAHL
jgi:hypothetical protein